jgi:hypothetical protein
MDKREEILLSLKEMFNNEVKEEPRYTVESKQIESKKYLSLVARDEEEFFVTSPDYEAFINLLKYYNTKELNYIVSKFNDNKIKIFTKYPDEEREKMLQDMRDFHSRLSNSNQRNIAFIEMMIVDWANNILKQIIDC